MLEAITFDFWGTLVDSGHNLMGHRAELLGRLLPRVRPERVVGAYEESWRRFGEGLSMGFGLGGATLLGLTLGILGESLAPPDHSSILRAWQEAILSDPPPFLDGAKDVLRYMRARGLMVALISDTGVTPGQVIRQMLRRAGALTLFDWLTFSNEIGVTKSMPEAFSGTLRALGVRPGEALHVGDLPETDVRGAKSVGMHSALVLEISGRRDGVDQADIVIERLRDLPEALERWEMRD
jgi:putative hydrolase of the HAD superfamily